MDGPGRVKRYLVNEVFYSLQGEGARAGTANVFVRFAKCNLACNVAEHGFDCDTEFETGEWWGLNHLIGTIHSARAGWVLLTGGEPALQADDALVAACHEMGWLVAIETNGTRPLPAHLDWVCVSPKPGAPVVLTWAHEVKCVLAAGQEPDDRGVRADNYFVSPAFKGDELDPTALAWCIDYVKAHPFWRLSCQQHKWWGVR